MVTQPLPTRYPADHLSVMSDTPYDYVICGGGPSGITAAYALASVGKRCLLVEREGAIGGCHRAEYAHGYWTEHSPRVYSSAYVNMKALLRRMGSSYDELFVPYPLITLAEEWSSLRQLTAREAGLLAGQMVLFVPGTNHERCRATSVEAFTAQHRFRPSSRAFLDSICRLTDGAQSNRYSMYELLQLVNQQLLTQSTSVPAVPTDQGLFRVWHAALDRTGLVDCLFHHEAERLEVGRGKDQSVRLSGVVLRDTRCGPAHPPRVVRGSRIFLALPPRPLYQLNERSSSMAHHAFLPSLADMARWQRGTGYDDGLAVVMHWDVVLELPPLWGRPNNDWGVAFMWSSHYTRFTSPHSRTVISTLITLVDTPSSATGKTANQSTRQELIDETVRQLQQIFAQSSSCALPPPDRALCHLGMRRVRDRWVPADTAFIAAASETAAPVHLAAASPCFPNLFNVGTQNNQSSFALTTFESATTNALALVHALEPETRGLFPIRRSLSLRDVVLWLVLFVALVALVLIMIGWFHRKHEQRRIANDDVNNRCKVVESARGGTS